MENGYAVGLGKVGGPRVDDPIKTLQVYKELTTRKPGGLCPPTTA